MTERIFPIRSVLYPTTTCSAPVPSPRPPLTRSASSLTKLNFTARFQHHTDDHGTNYVLNGYDGQLINCESEPIHAPGAIQAFGVLIAFDLDPTHNIYSVAQVSENSYSILGISPSTLFRTPNFAKLLSEDEQAALEDALESLDERDQDPENAETGPYTFQLSGLGSLGSGHTEPIEESRVEWNAYCAIHRPDRGGQPNRVILELELMEDHLHPLSTETIPATEPNDKGGMSSCGIIEPTEEDLLLSTVSLVKPLRALVKSRKGKAGRKGVKDSELDVVQLLSQVNEQFAKAEELESFLKITAGIFKELTDFDRCMVYQFDADYNGRVVAEQVDWTKTKDLYRGLNFPASDIPAQARELYKINRVRCLYDRDAPTARLCVKNLEEVNFPLNMTHCHLRAMSPIHVKYLANMGVRASASISITAFGTLYGLVACHRYGDYGHRVSFPVRQLCKLLGESVSRNIERLSYAKRLHARKLINTAPTSANPSGYIVAKAEDLLTLFDADFGVLSIGPEAKILGSISNSQELLAILEYLRVKCFTSLQSSCDITRDFPDIEYAAGFEIVSGMLMIPLSAEGKDFILFCRRGVLTKTEWAGNPYTNKFTSVDGEQFQPLEPRKSFASWSETVIGRCPPWTDEQHETANVLSLVYGKFIDIWRRKEEALAANQLTNLLLANASHEVRTPLNAIINYLELALDSTVDEEVRENLTRSHAASRTLIHVINDLLDLTRTEQGNELFLTDPFDLPGTIADAISLHRTECAHQGLTLDIIESPQGTPSTVLGDRGKVKNIISNVVANALRHTEKGGILIEWGELVDEVVGEDEALRKKDSIRIGISITDTGSGISDEKLETIFREFEQVGTVHTDSNTSDSLIVPPVRSAGLGLGLAVVARIVRNLGGQLRVESVLGSGSKFTFILPFRLPMLPERRGSLDLVGGAIYGDVGGGEDLSMSDRTFSAPGSAVGGAGEILGIPPRERRRTNSFGSTGSNRSRGSKRSDIDSLITAMSTSHMDGAGAPRAGRGDARPAVATGGKKSQGGKSSSRRAVSNGSIEVEDSNVPLRPIKMEFPSSLIHPTTTTTATAVSATEEVHDEEDLQTPTTEEPFSTSGARVAVEGAARFAQGIRKTHGERNSSGSSEGESDPSSISRRVVFPIEPNPRHDSPDSRYDSSSSLEPLSSSARSTPPDSPERVPSPGSAASPYQRPFRVSPVIQTLPPTPDLDPRPSGLLSPRHISDYRSPVPTTEVEKPLMSMRVLVVEDEPINRMIIQKRLQKDGHVVVLAEHGGEAIRIYKADPHFDIVLMDLQMPIVNGFQAATAIRTMEDSSLAPLSSYRPSTILNGRLPILAVSASLHERQRESIVEVGIDGWILKPIDFRRLNKLMRGSIDASKRREEIYRPGAWERGGWLEPAPVLFSHKSSSSSTRTTSPAPASSRSNSSAA